ncbi:MAG: GNAT family N-acetyltransferase [Lachnospiraceae bacterium]|nr:GNAT family N-acetyltransferase [Lachnospiraceae bacterium]
MGQYQNEIFDKVGESEQETVLAIYRSMVGMPGCTWSMDYPDGREITSDLAREALYCMRGQDGKILGLISVDEDEAVATLPLWNQEVKRPAELARLAVIQEYQNRGLARRLILSVMEILEQRGFDAVRYLVSPGNKKALASYAKLDFEYRGKAFLYEQEWLLYEKRFK